MNNYCGFIECYKGALTGNVYQRQIEAMRWLGVVTDSSTVAIFKIKLK